MNTQKNNIIKPEPQYLDWQDLFNRDFQLQGVATFLEVGSYFLIVDKALPKTHLNKGVIAFKLDNFWHSLYMSEINKSKILVKKQKCLPENMQGNIFPSPYMVQTNKGKSSDWDEIVFSHKATNVPLISAFGNTSSTGKSYFHMIRYSENFKLIDNTNFLIKNHVKTIL